MPAWVRQLERSVSSPMLAASFKKKLTGQKRKGRTSRGRGFSKGLGMTWTQIHATPCHNMPQLWTCFFTRYLGLSQKKTEISGLFSSWILEKVGEASGWCCSDVEALLPLPHVCQWLLPWLFRFEWVNTLVTLWCAWQHTKISQKAKLLVLTVEPTHSARLTVS